MSKPFNWCGVFRDGSSRILRISLNPGDNKTAYPYHVSVELPGELKQKLATHRDFPFEIEARPLVATTRRKEGVASLVIEGGILAWPGFGPCLMLFPVNENVLLPQLLKGLYDDFEDDQGLPWALPLSPYERVC